MKSVFCIGIYEQNRCWIIERLELNVQSTKPFALIPNTHTFDAFDLSKSTSVKHKSEEKGQKENENAHHAHS